MLLNSLQIHKLLENSSRAGSSTSPMSSEFLGWCIDLAREKVDSRLHKNKRPVRVKSCKVNVFFWKWRIEFVKVLLEEDLGSRAVFRMPDDGFATDNVLGLSHAFEKFLNPLMDNKIAYISVLPDPSQRWDVYLYPDHIDPNRDLSMSNWHHSSAQVCLLEHRSSILFSTIVILTFLETFLKKKMVFSKSAQKQVNN